MTAVDRVDSYCQPAVNCCQLLSACCQPTVNRSGRFRKRFVCKRGDCRRYFLMQPPKQKPGRKKQVFDGGSRIPVGAAVLDRAPYEIETVDEVWGVRCAPAPPRARAARH